MHHQKPPFPCWTALTAGNFSLMLKSVADLYPLVLAWLFGAQPCRSPLSPRVGPFSATGLRQAHKIRRHGPVLQESRSTVRHLNRKSQSSMGSPAIAVVVCWLCVCACVCLSVCHSDKQRLWRGGVVYYLCARYRGVFGQLVTQYCSPKG